MAAIPNGHLWAAAPPAGGGRHWRTGSQGVMYLNGVSVGTLAVTGWDTSWGFGMFRPDDRFARFAPAFGLWSRLMHAGGTGGTLSRDESDALARAENAMDAIKARLYFAADDAWVDVFQLNIDGELLEWKEY